VNAPFDDDKKRAPPLFGSPRMKLAPYAIIMLLLMWNISLQRSRAKATEPCPTPPLERQAESSTVKSATPVQPDGDQIAASSAFASGLNRVSTNLIKANTNEMQGRDLTTMANTNEMQGRDVLTATTSTNMMQGRDDLLTTTATNDMQSPMEPTAASIPSATAASPATPDGFENASSFAAVALSIAPAAAAAPTGAVAPEPAGVFRLDVGTACLSNTTFKDTSTAQCFDGCQEKYARAHCARCRCRACSYCPMRPGNSKMALDSSCLSEFTQDVPTAQCASFCKQNFALMHCKRCRCRACDFCPAVDTLLTAVSTAVAGAPKAQRSADPAGVNASAAASLKATRAVTTSAAVKTSAAASLNATGAVTTAAAVNASAAASLKATGAVTTAAAVNAGVAPSLKAGGAVATAAAVASGTDTTPSVTSPP